MKRKTFIQITALTGVSFIIPYLNKGYSPFGAKDPLIHPSVLARFCDDDQLRQIGKEYLERHNQENSGKVLKKMLLAKQDGKPFRFDNRGELGDFIDKKINADFRNGNVLLLHGWVLSQTEARQCALYSYEN